MVVDVASADEEVDDEGCQAAFITADADREELVSQVYDTTYGIIASTRYVGGLDDSIIAWNNVEAEYFTYFGSIKDEEDNWRVSSAPQIRVSRLLWN